jgi:D-alanyl-lipoteichoic acid acyltransferase DltB (MBOAT superfamily)
VHALLPLRHRLSFFALLSLASVVMAFGIGAGAWLFFLVGVLISLCHLPVRFTYRVALVLGAGVVLVLLRGGWLPSAVPVSIWPIFGAMLMFRLALYLYELRHGEVPSNPVRAVSYFFMLPNVCFPLYPVVDYRTFIQQHYAGNPDAIYRTGVRWMLRGLVQLLLYRLVYYHLTLEASQVRDLGTLLQYVLSTFLLYLRVSGHFHLIVGILHLFGFKLPETHHLYYLASSFTDFWRRINIYWKDFMMKLVYYPSFFRLRRYGTTVGLIGATLIVFVTTWALHSYQWFWLRGRFPVTAPDLLFWGVLAIFVVAATLVEARRGRQRVKPRRQWSAGLAFRTVGTFTVICVLWSLWSAETVPEWLSLWSAAGTASPRDWALLFGLLGIGLAIGGHAWGAAGLGEPRGGSETWRTGWRESAPTFAMTLMLVGLGTHPVQERLPQVAGAIVQSIQVARLSSRDAAMQERGYYENLTRVTNFSTELWRGYEPVLVANTPLNRDRTDFLLNDLRPSTTYVFKRKLVTINRWGMRDRDYQLTKPPRTVRIALLGPSDVWGSGVDDQEVFEQLVEDRLQRELEPSSGLRFEILNFAVPSFSLLQQLAILEDRVGKMHPDIVIITSHPNNYGPLVEHLTRVIVNGVPIPYDSVAQVVAASGVTRETDRAAAIRRLNPYIPPLLDWTISCLAERIRELGARPVWLVLRLPTGENDSEQGGIALAERAGFDVIDLSKVFEGADEAGYVKEEWDNHPNARGHQLLADKLFRALVDRSSQLATGGQASDAK